MIGGGFVTKKESTMQRILAAALDEFGTHGYEQASTNQIAEVADVSKGLVFKYYESKSNLYYLLFINELNRMLDQMNEYLAKHQTSDHFERIVDVIFWKASYALKHPKATALLLEAIAKPPLPIRTQIYSHLSELTKLSIRLFFDDIPMDKIRPEYTKEDVIRNLELAAAGLQATYVTPNTTIESLMAMKDQSVAFLKTVLRGMEN
jgi:TetR/AcrR family transcriptional regulator